MESLGSTIPLNPSSAIEISFPECNVRVKLSKKVLEGNLEIDHASSFQHPADALIGRNDCNSHDYAVKVEKT